ncbi:MAG: S8 family peptidase [Vicinamibacteria bacterium]
MKLAAESTLGRVRGAAGDRGRLRARGRRRRLRVTIAFVDSGYGCIDPLNRNDRGQNRILAGYDAINNVVNTWAQDDGSGHGTHVMTAAVSSYGTDAAGSQVVAGLDRGGVTYHGVAPGADLVSVRAFDANGQASYASVIRGISWVVANAKTYNIRVMNLSFAAPPRSYYWEDPLNQAVMKAWKAGIVVVASAGNGGPNPMTIGVPGNVPYVVTVGAMTDRNTPSVGTDDVLASFSAAGPTYEGFVKPEVVAPGGHLMAMMNVNTTIAVGHPEFYNGNYGSYFKMSGTSQAAAVVSGMAALVLSANPPSPRTR